MCLLVVAYRYHPEYPLLVLANRDEFFQRRTETLRWWPGRDILAGRDLEAGGTWMAMTRRGRFAALTNYREGGASLGATPSRGHLVRDLMESPLSVPDFMTSHGDRGYRGYNLLAGDSRGIYYGTNRGNGHWLTPGIYGLSNGPLDSNWPKVHRAKDLFTKTLQQVPPTDHRTFLDLFLDTLQPADEELPATGIPLEWERVLSTVFIHSPGYGTRSTTFLAIHRDGAAEVTERSFDDEGRIAGEANFTFPLALEPA